MRLRAIKQETELLHNTIIIKDDDNGYIDSGITYILCVACILHFLIVVYLVPFQTDDETIGLKKCRQG